MSSRETIAPSGLDSAPKGSGLFASLPAAFGRFEVRKLLGAGAMGKVYLAFDPEMQREVALKIPKFEAADEPVLLERFWREARATGAMSHDNICKLYEVGEINGTHFISMGESRGLAIWKLGIGGRDALTANTAFLPPILDFQSA